MRLGLLEGAFALVRLPAGTEPPPLPGGPLAAVVRDRSALTLVAPEDAAPAGEASRGWRALEVEGPLDLATTGVLAALAATLRDAGVPIFVVSTYDTDVVLVPGDRLGDAVTALRDADHDVAT